MPYWCCPLEALFTAFHGLPSFSLKGPGPLKGLKPLKGQTFSKKTDPGIKPELSNEPNCSEDAPTSKEPKHSKNRSSSTNAATSWNALPSELREIIYKEVFSKREPVIIQPEPPFLHPSKFQQICRQFRQETLKLFYSTSDFYMMEGTPVEEFVQHTGRENLKDIQKLHIEVPLSWDEAVEIQREHTSYAEAKHLVRPMTAAERLAWAFMQRIYLKADDIADVLVENGVPEDAIHIRLPCPPNMKITDRKWVSLADYKQLIPIERNRPFGQDGQRVYYFTAAFCYEKVPDSSPNISLR